MIVVSRQASRLGSAACGVKEKTGGRQHADGLRHCLGRGGVNCFLHCELITCTADDLHMLSGQGYTVRYFIRAI